MSKMQQKVRTLQNITFVAAAARLQQFPETLDNGDENDDDEWRIFAMSSLYVLPSLPKIQPQHNSICSFSPSNQWRHWQWQEKGATAAISAIKAVLSTKFRVKDKDAAVGDRHIFTSSL